MQDQLRNDKFAFNIYIKYQNNKFSWTKLNSKFTSKKLNIYIN